MNTRAARRAARRRAILAAGTALLCLAVAASAPAAARYGDWSAPVNLGTTINTTVQEAGPAISRDGLSLYFYSDRAGGFGLTDIWVSKRASAGDPWGAPVNLGPTVNSASSDFVPTFSRDGHWMFFASFRAGGFGNADIWASWRPDVHDDFGWQAPVNLGAGVNTASNDNGVGYFENDGGAPQLFFGSDRPGGSGEADVYVSERRPDGTWAPATRIPELSSPGADNRPNIRDDGLEIVFYSNRPGGLGGNDLWATTRTTVDAPWSTPVNLGAPVNSSADDGHPYLSADGRTLFAYSSRPGGTGSRDLNATTRNALLTVTANDQSRLFGQTNPLLTYAIAAFVGSDTAGVVSGSAACSTTAMPWSPAGDYPITCTVGSLSAPGYSFDTFVAGTLTVSYTRPCMAGPSAGPLHVGAGEAVCIGAGGSQTGPVTVAAGGSLSVEGGRITGPVVANGAAVVRICGATITGPLTVTGSTRLVLVGGDAATGPCDPSTIVGAVRITGNAGGVEFSGNRVVGPLRITGNTGTLPPPHIGPVHAVGNAVTGPVAIQP
jgi:hypothetical protein